MRRRGFTLGRQCSKCGIEICDHAKTGLCRKHSLAVTNANAEIRSRAVASIKRTMATPACRAKLILASKLGARRRLADPVKRAALADHMRRIQPLTCTPEALARRDMVKLGQAISAAKLAWCPEGYRDLYLRLMRNHRVKKVDARQMVLEQYRADLAKLSPFERQQRALEKGAQLVANDRAPMFGEAVKIA